MKIKTLFKNIPGCVIKGSKETFINGICSDSKTISFGNLFIAKKGCTYDATQFIPEAVQGGAAAILTDLYNPFLEKKITQIIYPHVAQIEADIAAQYYGCPSKDLLTIGITGTNGKTTTSYLIKKLLDAISLPCGLIGTIETITGKKRFFSQLSTPDCIRNQKLLKEMVLHNCKACVMEATSHGLDQGRLKHVSFDIALFTNLSHDHLDYHKSLEKYFEAKKKLFFSLKKKKKTIAILNADSSYYTKILKEIDVDSLTFGIENAHADIIATNIKQSLSGMQFSVRIGEKKEDFFVDTLGIHNVYNILAAIAVGNFLHVPLVKMKRIFKKFPNIPGRLEKIQHKKECYIFVDFAHTPEALKNVLKTLKEVSQARLCVIFGCGGQRDKKKRKEMAKISENFSDFVIITNDNPRKEDPKKIVEDIIAGFSDNMDYAVEPDRKTAINQAIQWAKKGDIILVAGKGHESNQVFANKTLPFNDRLVIEELCK